jgi:DNA-binding HxlR family transcriptional regulator
MSIQSEYSLTEIGKGFEPVLLSAASFSMMYMPRTSLQRWEGKISDQLLIGQR